MQLPAKLTARYFRGHAAPPRRVAAIPRGGALHLSGLPLRDDERPARCLRTLDAASARLLVLMSSRPERIEATPVARRVRWLPLTGTPATESFSVARGDELVI